MYVDKKDTSVKILIIDDMGSFFIEDFKRNIQRSFPLAQVDAAKGFDGIEDLIIKGQYTVILLDVLLHNWKPHPVFKICGVNFIPFILKNSPNTFMISISSKDEWNKEMIEEGAHGAINKSYINSKNEITEEFTIKQ